MPEYLFKNGISIQIPDGIIDLENKWADVQVQMSLVLFHMSHQPPPVVQREKKPYTFSERSKAKRLAWKLKKEKKAKA